MTEITKAYDKEGQPRNNLSESGSWGFGWQWTNTATYKFNLADKHDFTVLVGTEALKQGLGRNITAQRYDYQFERDPNTWTISNGATTTVNATGGMGQKTTMFGLFGRVDYSYMGKYLVTATAIRN